MNRQEAIKYLDQHRYLNTCGRKSLEESNEAIDMAIEALSADAVQGWIPCSEGLPDDLAEVNVTWVNHDPEPYYDFVKDKPASASAVFYKGKWFWYSSVCVDILAEYGKNDTDEVDNAIEILAWMPLPEPYKAESEEV